MKIFVQLLISPLSLYVIQEVQEWNGASKSERAIYEGEEGENKGSLSFSILLPLLLLLFMQNPSGWLVLGGCVGGGGGGGRLPTKMRGAARRLKSQRSGAFQSSW